MQTRRMNEPWTAHVVGRMHRYCITRQELAKACNYTPSYISEVLHGNKRFRSKESYELTKNRIVGTLEGMIQELEESNG